MAQQLAPLVQSAAQAAPVHWAGSKGTRFLRLCVACVLFGVGGRHKLSTAEVIRRFLQAEQDAATVVPFQQINERAAFRALFLGESTALGTGALTSKVRERWRDGEMERERENA